MKIEKDPNNDHPMIGQQRRPFYDVDERELRRGFTLFYGRACSIELRRPVVDVFVDFPPPAQGYPTDERLAAVVYLTRGSELLAVSIVSDDWSPERLEVLRNHCEAERIRLFPVNRSLRYPLAYLRRVAVCEEARIAPRLATAVVPQAYCPNCGSPLMHRFKLAKDDITDNSYYACAGFGSSEVNGRQCSGFTCGASEIADHVNPDPIGVRDEIHEEMTRALPKSGEDDHE